MAKQDPLRDSKEWKQFTTEHDRKFRMMVEDLRNRGVDDMREVKDVLKHQLMNDTTLQGLRTPLARKKAKLEKDRHKQLTKKTDEHIKETTRLGEAMARTGKAIDRFTQGAKERAKDAARTLREGLMKDLGTVFQPLSGLADIPFLGTLLKSIGVAIGIQNMLGKVRDKLAGKTLEVQEEAVKSANSMEQMTQDLVDMLGKIMNHITGGPTPAELREMELEKSRSQKSDEGSAKPPTPDDDKEGGGLLSGLGSMIGSLLGSGGLMGLLGKVFGKGGILLKALGFGGKGLLIGLKGMFGLAKGGLGLLLKGLFSPAGGLLVAALGGFLAGKALYDNLISPWLEGYWVKEREEYAKRLNENRFAGAGTREQSMIKVGDKEEKAFTITDKQGKSRIVGESEAKAHATKMGMTMDEAQAQGFVKKKTFTHHKGKVMTGQKLIEDAEAASKEEQMERDLKSGKHGPEGMFINRAKKNSASEVAKLEALIDEHGLDSKKVQGHLFNDTLQIYQNMLERSIEAGLDPSIVFDNYHGGAGGRGQASSLLQAALRGHKEAGFKTTSKLKSKIKSALNKGKIPALAKGGLVPSAMFGMLGEAGPELVMPLDKSVETIGAVLASALKQTPMGMIPNFGSNGLDQGLGLDLGNNSMLKMNGGGKGGGGGAINAPTFNNPVTNSTSIMNVNNQPADHPAFQREKKEQMDHLLWAGM